MIKFKDILSEIRIQPAYIPDPVKIKGLEIGDKIEWVNYNKKYQGVITQIEYRKYGSIDVQSWNEADYVAIYIRNGYSSYSILYCKNPRNEDEQGLNEEFNTIEKITQ